MKNLISSIIDSRKFYIHAYNRCLFQATETGFLLFRYSFMTLLLIIASSGMLYAQALQEAAAKGDLQEVRKILEKYPELLNSYDKQYERTAMHWAALNGHKPVVEFLFSKGADFDRKDRENHSPLYLASINKHFEIVSFLKRLGATDDGVKLSVVPPSAQKVQGMHYTGIPPTPPTLFYRIALIIAFLLMIAAAFLQWFLNKRLLKEPGSPGYSARKVLIIITVVILYFIALEASLQVYVHYHPYRRYIPDPVLHWKANPVNEEKPHIFNKDIFFDFEYNEKLTTKDEKTFRILCLGDSQTNGLPWAGTMDMTYPMQLEKKLKEKFPGKKIEVINMGIAGYTSYQGIIYLRKVGLKYKPDMVILAFGNHDGNTATASDKEVSREDSWDSSLRRFLYQSQIYLLIRKKVLERRSEVRNPDGSMVFRRVSPEDYTQNLQEFIKMGTRNSFSVALLILPNLSDQMTAHPQYTEITRKTAEKNGALLLDCVAKMKKIPEKEREKYFQMDNCHFTVEGNGKISDFILEELEPVLRKRL